MLFDKLVLLHQHQWEKTDAILLCDAELADFSPGATGQNSRYSESAGKRAKGMAHDLLPRLFAGYLQRFLLAKGYGRMLGRPRVKDGQAWHSCALTCCDRRHIHP